MTARTAIEIITSITSLAPVSNGVIDGEIFEEAKKDMVMSSESPSTTKRVELRKLTARLLSRKRMSWCRREKWNCR